MAKGQVAEGLLWVLYVPFTAIIVLALVTIPTRLLEQTVQPLQLDAAIQDERIVQSLTRVSPALGVEEGVVRDDLQSAGLVMGEKKWGFKLFVPNPNSQVKSATVFGNKEFYNDAVPLAPVKYKRYQTAHRMTYAGTLVTVQVDEVFPQKYEKLT